MEDITLRIKESRYILFLQFLKTLSYVEIVKPASTMPLPKPLYDFSDLAGKLQWKGDAVEEQRRLRNEW